MISSELLFEMSKSVGGWRMQKCWLLGLWNREGGREGGFGTHCSVNTTFEDGGSKHTGELLKLWTYCDHAGPHLKHSKVLAFVVSKLVGLGPNKVHIRVFHKWHFAKKKRCNTSMHPSRVYINQIWKNFFPKTSLEGLATWSKKATQGSLFVTKTYFLVGPDLCQVNF